MKITAEKRIASRCSGGFFPQVFFDIEKKHIFLCENATAEAEHFFPDLHIQELFSGRGRKGQDRIHGNDFPKIGRRDFFRAAEKFLECAEKSTALTFRIAFDQWIWEEFLPEIKARG